MASGEFVGKQELIAKHGRSEGDTGSPEVQIGLLTKRLEILSEHFKKHPQDVHSRRGLLKIVSRRKKLLTYLKNEDIARYRAALAEFGLRK
ncbi:MAG: 30S ribosomal protein S15 [Bdellovibrionota bacterium]|jgi:small subunit ribosomal protein S15